ncbi:hypothetical protein PPACK8108_LOCUS6210 [Phakopsora pachyrhizi]|uniref:DUF7143 domain-containing protein n=1 Tax=Phakopsora pachyrhizi TaxID=170000 RepID=A0A0S1MK73_PHAPC|nr:hypothetical protein PPACK8108_LOCUS6210 [Phakopsora pachyrhizi]
MMMLKKLNFVMILFFQSIYLNVNCRPTITERQSKACFIVGNAVLPKDVVVNDKLTCDFKTQPFPGIPDVSSGNIKYSQVDFQSDSSISSVGFGLKNFQTDGSQADLTRFKQLDDVYGATNAALRSTGGDQKQNGLAKLKGTAFFIGFQLARINKDQPGLERLLGKVLKNCVSCSDADRKQVQDLAAASGVKA